jgi:hypothetical protein
VAGSPHPEPWTVFVRCTHSTIVADYFVPDNDGDLNGCQTAVTATVRDALNDNIPNVEVSFGADMMGSPQPFARGFHPNPTVATTDSNGVAHTMAASSSGGFVRVTATVTGDSNEDYNSSALLTFLEGHYEINFHHSVGSVTVTLNPDLAHPHDCEMPSATPELSGNLAGQSALDFKCAASTCPEGGLAASAHVDGTLTAYYLVSWFPGEYGPTPPPGYVFHIATTGTASASHYWEDGTASATAGGAFAYVLSNGYDGPHEVTDLLVATRTSIGLMSAPLNATLDANETTNDNPPVKENPNGTAAASHTPDTWIFHQHVTYGA